MEPNSKDARPLNIYNILIIAFATFGSITYGYCASVIGSTLGQPTFISYFALDTRSNAAAIEGAMNGLFQGGGLLGVLFFGWMGDWSGRCKAIFAGSIITIVGGALQAGSIHIAMFLVARFVTGYGVGGLVMLVPLWQSEVAPPHSRGLLVGLHGVSILIGYNLSAWLGYAFFHVHANGAEWRIPLAIQCIPALILASGIFTIPESPRWLVDNSHFDAAKKILGRIHESKQASGDDFAVHEYKQIETQLAYEKSQPSTWLSLWTIPQNRKRSIIGFGTLFAGQFTGTLVIANYGPTLYRNLGYQTSDQLLISCGWLLMGFFANILNAYLLDRVGRKFLMIIGLFGCVVALIGEVIMVALFVNTANKGGQAAAVFFLYLHLAFYGSCIDGSTYVYGSEIWPTHLRAKGFATSVSGLFVASLILLVAAPTGFQNVGWKFYLVMIIVTVLNIIFFWVYFPETKGLPLEEIAEKFGDQVTVELDGVADRESTTQLDGDISLTKAQN